MDISIFPSGILLEKLQLQIQIRIYKINNRILKNWLWWDFILASRRAKFSLNFD